MKAYKAWDNASIENYSTIVFAENSREAKKIAFVGLILPVRGEEF